MRSACGEDGIGSPGPEGTEGCEPPDVGAEEQNMDLCKSSKDS